MSGKLGSSHGSYRDSHNPSADLDKVLPKLAKRIGTQNGESSPVRSSPRIQRPPQSSFSRPIEGSEPSNISPRRAERTTLEQSPPHPERAARPQGSPHPTPRTMSSQSIQQPRTRTRKGSITYKPQVDLPPELEELRSRDISPDVDSAAERALNIAASLAQIHTKEAAQTAVPTRRGSLMQDGEPERRVEGREIQQDHAQYALTYGMMLGIRVCTGRRDVNLDELSTSRSLSTLLEEQELTIADYDAAHQLIFLPEGNNSSGFPTPPHKLPFAFTFKDYMPNVFRAVRTLSGIEEADYMMSLAGDFNYIEFIANSKSGQFFFYSHDGKYMIKTQTKEECKLLRKIMPDYVKHLTDNPDSLLVRFFGMHRVKMKSLQSKTYFVIMSSVFDTPKSIQIKYDLKGSTVGRITSPEACREGAVQKDLNLVQSGRKFRFGAEHIDILYSTLKADVNFLRDQNIMDYSLLIGVHDGKSGRPQRRASGVVLASKSAPGTGVHHPGGALGLVTNESSVPVMGSIFQSYCGGIRSSSEVNEIYFMGIIDILQLYNAGKRLENFFKGFTHDRKQLSAVDPSLYAERMLDFVMLHTDYNEIMTQRKQQQRAALLKNKR